MCRNRTKQEQHRNKRAHYKSTRHCYIAMSYIPQRDTNYIQINQIIQNQPNEPANDLNRIELNSFET